MEAEIEQLPTNMIIHDSINFGDSYEERHSRIMGYYRTLSGRLCQGGIFIDLATVSVPAQTVHGYIEPGCMQQALMICESLGLKLNIVSNYDTTLGI